MDSRADSETDTAEPVRARPAGETRGVEGPVTRLGETILRFRWPIIVLTLLVVGAIGSGARFLYFQGDYRVFFSGDNPQLKAFEELQAIYTKRDNVLFAVAPKPGTDPSIFRPEVMAAIGALTEGAWQLPFATRVDSLTNFQHTYAEGDDLVVEDLAPDPATTDPRELERIRQVALAEPLLRRALVAEDGGAAGVNAVIRFETESREDLFAVVDGARALAEEVRQSYPEVEVRISGVVMHNNAFTEAGNRDGQTLIPAMYGLILLLLAVLFRSIAATFATTCVIVLATAVALGMAGWLGFALTPVSVLAPTLIMTLAVADSVHLLLTLLQDLRAGRARRPAILDTLRVNARPVFLTSLTTGIGFLAMNSSDVPPIRDLGNITAMGVVAAFFLSLVFLPALLAVLPWRIRARAPAPGAPASAIPASATTSSAIPASATRASTTPAAPAWTGHLAELILAHRRAFGIGVALLAVVLLAFVPRIRLDDQFVEYFDSRIEFRNDTDFVLDHLTGVYQLEMSLSSGAPGGIAEPEFLATLDRFARWWRARPDVVHVASLSDTFARLNQNLHGDDPAYYRLPEDRQLAAQYLLLYEMSLPYGLDLNDQIDIDKSSVRFTVTFGRITSTELRAAAEAGEAWLRQNAPPAMHAVGASPAIMFAHVSENAISSMISGTVMGFALITLCLVLALRSVRFGLLSLLPNLLPTFMAFGVWGIVVGQVGFGISVVLAMTLGIVVDDSVHFMTKYLRARRVLGLSPEDSVRYVFARVGQALWVTTVALVGGFALLATSAFAQNSDMGLLTAITIGFALVADFFLLPAILLAVDRA